MAVRGRNEALETRSCRCREVKGGFGGSEVQIERKTVSKLHY